jgi:hypothetical protein
MQSSNRILLAFAGAAFLAAAGCDEQARPSGDAKSQQDRQTDDHVVTGQVPPGDVETDRDPTPETSTGGIIPKDGPQDD